MVNFSNRRPTKHICRWKIILLVLGIVLIGVIWFSSMLGKEISGDVYAAYSASQLQGHARCLWYHVAQNTEQFSKGAWPSNDLRTSGDYFRYLFKQGYVPKECISCILEIKSVGLVNLLSSRLKRQSSIKSSNEDINRENVIWAVVVGCDGKLFSDINKPADNLPFLITRNVTGEYWIPASGVKLMKKDKWQRVVVITFGGQILHFTGGIPDSFSKSGLEGVTNRLMLAQP